MRKYINLSFITHPSYALLYNRVTQLVELSSAMSSNNFKLLTCTNENPQKPCDNGVLCVCMYLFINFFSWMLCIILKSIRKLVMLNKSLDLGKVYTILINRLNVKSTILPIKVSHHHTRVGSGVADL